MPYDFFYFALFGLFAGLSVSKCEVRIELFMLKETSQLTRLRSTVKNPQADICDRLFKFLIKTWRKEVLFSLIIFLYLLVVLVSRRCSFVLKSCNHIINVVCEPDERSNEMFHWRFLQSRSFRFVTCFTPSVNFLKDRMKCFTKGFIKLWKSF